GSACTSGIPESSHVLQATGLNAAEADSSVRFSFGRFTGDHEPREAAMVVASALHGTG
ncbi:MAG: aminotransferase, partial [Chloroflexi bacterium]|nr:aminotransferase [Chloroflexota bacterium]